jgi:glycine/sarcosine N-methyltransferase
MTEFYQSIARHYDDIFPLSDMLKRFLLSFGVSKEDHILDIGCATREVALFLSPHCARVTGIDLDPDLIQIAATKQMERNRGNTQFLVRDMNELDIFSSDQFQFALCLGNTLVHIISLEMLDNFIGKVAGILSDGGKFIFQILNYEKILARRAVELPLIDTETITFERRYDHETHRPLLAFNTRLTIKATSEIIDNSIDLYPLQREELMNISSTQLFRSVQFLGGFDGRTFVEEDDLLIAVWEK